MTEKTERNLELYENGEGSTERSAEGEEERIWRIQCRHCENSKFNLDDEEDESGLSPSLCLLSCSRRQREALVFELRGHFLSDRRGRLNLRTASLNVTRTRGEGEGERVKRASVAERVSL